jgi:hypothetical protein
MVMVMVRARGRVTEKVTIRERDCRHSTKSLQERHCAFSCVSMVRMMGSNSQVDDR